MFFPSLQVLGCSIHPLWYAQSHACGPALQGWVCVEFEGKLLIILLGVLLYWLPINLDRGHVHNAPEFFLTLPVDDKAVMDAEDWDVLLGVVVDDHIGDLAVQVHKI